MPTVIAGESFEEYARGLQEDIERDCQVKFGRNEKIAFARLIDEKTGKEIGQEASGIIWSTLKERGYLDSAGDITNKFLPEKEGFMLEFPTEFEPMRASIIDEMKRYVFKNRVINAREHRTLKYNKRVGLNEDFQSLWLKINKKTRYSVEFKAEELIVRAVSKIKKMDTVRPVRIMIDRTGVGITEAGVEGLQVMESRTEFVASEDQILHLCVHSARHVFNMGLCAMNDLTESLRRYRHELDWRSLISRARRRVPNVACASICGLPESC